MEFTSLNKAAAYAHVNRQAIFMAIKKGRLKAAKRIVAGIERWVILQSDLDAYRASKYIRDDRIVEGKKLFDVEDDRWSVLHVSKFLTQKLGRPYPTQHIYYLLRTGQIRAAKHGGSWILSKAAVLEMYERERVELAEVAE